MNEIIETPVSSKEITQLQNMTLFFFAYRGFTADSDRMLKDIGFGRAHHRVLFFVCRKPGMSVAELLQILAITKQSLARVLKQMISKGYIVQKTGPEDRRQRLLYPTAIGNGLILSLSQLQSARLSKAIENSGVGNEEHITQFLKAMIDPREHDLMDKLTKPNSNS